MATLGRYELRDRLGRGGFATVYRAWDPRLRREVALKALSLDWAEDDGVRARFLAEAQKLAGLSHPNIVTVFELSDPDERPYFTMELIEGRSLAELLRDGNRLVLPHVVEIVGHLAGAIDTLHAARIVHRDVKAPNIMLSNSGRVVLMDLGIARDLDGPQHTSRSMVLLSAETAAPEQIQSHDVGPAADIYALGIVTYQMLAGRPPFLGDTAALLYSHVHVPPPPLWELCPGLPASVYAAVDAALAKDPAARPATATTFARMLTGVATAAGTAARAGATPSLPLEAQQTAPFATTLPGGGPTQQPSTKPTSLRSPGAADGPALPVTPLATRGGFGRLPLALAGAGALALVIAVAAVLWVRGGGSDGVAEVPTGQVAAAVETCSPPEAGTLPLGAAPMPLTLAAAGEKTQFTFGACKGQRVSLGVTQVRAGDTAVDVSIISPDTAAVDGKPLASASVSKDGRALTAGPLPATGTYTVVVGSKSPAGGSVTLTLSPELSGAIQVNGDSMPVAFERPGQGGRWTFEASQGQRLTLAVSKLRFDTEIAVRILAPDTAVTDGEEIVKASVGKDGKVLPTGPLPADGTYTVLVNPGLATGSLTLTLSEDVDGGAASPGDPITLAIDRPGQWGRITFDGAKGKQVSVIASRVALGPANYFGALGYLSVFDPSGKPVVKDADVSKDGRYIDTFTLPADGMHELQVAPFNLNTGNITLVIHDVEPVTAPVRPGGQAVTVTSTTPGQKPRLTFDGARGQRVSVVASEVGIGPTAYFGTLAYLSILGPDGKPIVKDAEVSKDGRYVDTVTLPVAGSYAIQLVPYLANTGKLTIALHDAPPVSGTLAPGGPPVTVAATTPGQKGELTLDGRAGQQLRLAASDPSFAPANYFGAVGYISILAPDGKALVKDADIPKGGKTLDPFTLPATGTYTVIVSPFSANTGKVTLTLSGG